MTDDQATDNEVHATIPLDIPPPPLARPLEWRRAVRALRELINNPDDTEKAFEVVVALGDAHDERLFQRFLAQAHGGRLIAERPSLVELLSDRAWLAGLPADSFGRAYLDYLDRTGLDPAGLLRLKDSMEARLWASGDSTSRLDSARDWFRDRSILMHDLWHVLTGYGTDELGEAALLPFSYAQAGGRANALLVIGAALQGARLVGLGFLRYLYEAWQRGRHAAWLIALPYEELLPQPLDDVRRGARIEPATTAHRNGILRGSVTPAIARRTV
jgi:ubiquinone biosynthesis protein COQ4